MRIPPLLRTFRLIVACVALLLSGVAPARTPPGWNFLEYGEALKVARAQGKPVFVYYGFDRCPYCEYANKHTFSSEELRKLYSGNYVLAYFDIRGNPEDLVRTADGKEMRRAEAVKYLKASPVPAWAFLDPQGREVLARRGSRTKAHAFMQFDAYVAGGEYRKASFESFLASRGWVEEKVE